MVDTQYDVSVIGGGIVGLATALALTQRRSELRLTVLEKEKQVAGHQTGHNSGVIHSGIYYKPGSLKARLCVEGARRMKEFCEQENIRYERCGKVIAATDENEFPRLDTLYERGMANGVAGLEKIGPERLREIEPHANGLRGIYAPNTSIVDYTQVALAMRDRLAQRGVTVRTATQAVGIERDQSGLRISTTQGEISTRQLINCAGLYSDRVARMAGLKPQVRILPFRGEYYMLKSEKRNLVNGLVYPVPDPSFPFLGVHFTRTVHGQVEAGPNAVLAFAREGYTRSKVNPAELAATFSYVGFWTMAKKYWRMGTYEFYRSFSKTAFVGALRRLIPEIEEMDGEAGGAGVRAQAVTAQGELADDFILLETPAAVHVLNAPSPAATASLAIGDYIAARATVSFGLR